MNKKSQKKWIGQSDILEVILFQLKYGSSKKVTKILEDLAYKQPQEKNNHLKLFLNQSLLYFNVISWIPMPAYEKLKYQQKFWPFFKENDTNLMKLPWFSELSKLIIYIKY